MRQKLVEGKIIMAKKLYSKSRKSWIGDYVSFRSEAFVEQFEAGGEKWEDCTINFYGPSGHVFIDGEDAAALLKAVTEWKEWVDEAKAIQKGK